MSTDKNLLKRLTLLYVEDDEIIRNELSQLLANFFSQVLVAKDGKEGLRTFLENQDTIDIILTDINMPLYNGIDMVKKIFISILTKFDLKHCSYEQCFLVALATIILYNSSCL